MEALLNWSIEATLALSILFLIYFFCFRNNTSIKLRRVILLGILIVSICLPFISIETAPKMDQELAFVHFDEVLITKINESIRPSDVSSEPIIGIIAESKAIVSTQQFIYLLGLGLFTFLLLTQLGKLLFIFITGKWAWEDHIAIVHHRFCQAPSSFLFAVLLPGKTEYDEKEWRIILEHEKQHLKQRHSLDLLLASILQVFMWFNPLLLWIKRELKYLHEALADKATLDFVDYKDYLNILLSSAFSTKKLSLSHSFGQEKGLLKRIKLIQKQQSTMKRTSLSLCSFLLLSISVVSVSALQGQQASITTEMIPQDSVSMELKAMREMIVPGGHIRSLTEKHQAIYNKLKEEFPEKKLTFRYFRTNEFQSLTNPFVTGQEPVFVTRLSKGEKIELAEIAALDTAGFRGGSEGMQFYTYKDAYPELEQIIQDRYNFFMVYEYGLQRINRVGAIIYNADEVDTPPEVLGGIESLEKSVALDMVVPNELDRDRLPELVEFSFIVEGGSKISGMNLLTELKGSDRKNEAYYLFFGEVHNKLRSRIAEFNPWKRGIKDGNEVLVRVTVSIPTEYML